MLSVVVFCLWHMPSVFHLQRHFHLSFTCYLSFVRVDKSIHGGYTLIPFFGMAGSRSCIYGFDHARVLGTLVGGAAG